MSTKSPKQVALREEEAPIQLMHFTARITVGGQVIVHRIDASSRASALLQLRCLERQASFALLESH
jgi:hypothetical protein